MPPLQPILIDKPLGATPLQALALLRRAAGLPVDRKLAYAGRLDPMASGLLPVLHGELLHRQEDFWYLPKRYEATIAVGLRTDSFDLLGMPECMSADTPSTERITGVVRDLVGKTYLSVPYYSSYRLEGKQLPVHRMAVNQIDVLSIDDIDAATLGELVQKRVPLVQGDFRQPFILSAWQGLLERGGQWPLVRLDIRCGSGTYIRSLAHELGRRLQNGAMLVDLRRTQVGLWRITDPTVIRLVW